MKQFSDIPFFFDSSDRFNFSYHIKNKMSSIIKLYPQSSTVQDDGIQRQAFVNSFTSTDNPTTFTFDNVLKDVNSIEIRRAMMSPAEHVIENYRNTPFILLSRDWTTKYARDDYTKTMFKYKCGIDPDILNKSLINVDYLTDSFLSLDYIYGVSSLPVEEIKQYTEFEPYAFMPQMNFNTEASVDLEPLLDTLDSLDESEDLLIAADSAKMGFFPFTIPTGNFTVQGIKEALTFLRFMLWCLARKYVDKNLNYPLIHIGYDELNNKLYLFGQHSFVIIPGCACRIFGFRRDGVYHSVFNQLKLRYEIVADSEPFMKGPEIVYLQLAQVNSLNSNREFECMASIYLKENNGIYQNYCPIYRNIQNIPFLNNITIQFYTDFEKKQLYMMNGKEWHVEIIIQGNL
jgi:hypothetical protein